MNTLVYISMSNNSKQLIGSRPRYTGAQVFSMQHSLIENIWDYVFWSGQVDDIQEMRELSSAILHSLEMPY